MTLYHSPTLSSLYGSVLYFSFWYVYNSLVDYQGLRDHPLLWLWDAYVGGSSQCMGVERLQSAHRALSPLDAQWPAFDYSITPLLLDIPLEPITLVGLMGIDENP